MGMAYYNEFGVWGGHYAFFIIKHLWRQGKEMGEACRYPNLEFHTYYGSFLLYSFQATLALSRTVFSKSN
jgi:hypothetical protein